MSIAGKIFRAQCRYLPKNRFFDRIIVGQGFLYAHRRMPKKRMWLNDVLHQEKVSKDLDDPIYAFTTDKEYVKYYVSAVAGRQFAVETLGIIRSEEELVNFDFPSDCCIKPTHLSGHVAFRRSNSPVDRDLMKAWFQKNHYLISRERQYKTLKPKIIVEPILADPKIIRDYKVFCYQGEPTVVQVDFDRHDHHRRKYYSKHFDELPFSMVYPRLDEPISRPERWDDMIEVARALSQPFRFCRVDFYLTPSVFVGEITHHHESAYGRFIPAEDEACWSKAFFDGKNMDISKNPRL